MTQKEFNSTVSEMFGNNFFVELKEYIFDRNYNDYLNNYILKDCTREDIIYALHDPKQLEANYEKIDINSFADFLSYIENDSVFSFEISIKVLKILYLIEKISSAKYKDNYFEIKISAQNIISDFYDKEIIGKLATTKLENLFSKYRELNQFIVFEHTDNIMLIKNRILLFVFDYITTYLKTLALNLRLNMGNLLEVYKLEAKLALNSIDEDLNKDIVKSIKEIQMFRYKKEKGRKSRNLNISREDWFYTIRQLRDILNEHKKLINEIIDKKVDKLKKENDFNTIIKDYDYTTSKILSIYFHEKLNNETINVKDCIYKFIDEEYELGFIKDNDFYAGLDNMKHCIRRHLKKDKI